MQILKFKLVGNGGNGMLVEANEYLKSSGNFVIVDNVKRERKVIVPEAVMKEIAKLKYYFLNLTGHWHPSFTPFYDRLEHAVIPVTASASDDHLLLKDMWQKTTIMGAKAEGGSFLIIGKMESVSEKYISLVTPKITMEDDLAFYDECMTVLDGIAKAIASYLKEGVVALDQYREKMPAQAINGKSTEEITEMVINDLQERGAIIMMDSMYSKELDGGEAMDAVVVKSGSIDGKSLADSSFEDDPDAADDMMEAASGETNEDDLDFKDPEFEPEKVNVFGSPAAKIPTDEDDHVDQAGDVSKYEHTENMGMAGIDADVEADW